MIRTASLAILAASAMLLTAGTAGAAASLPHPVESAPGVAAAGQSCATTKATVARQVRREGKYPASRMTRTADVKRCHGRWAYVDPDDGTCDCAYMARFKQGRWRFAFGFPATPQQQASLPSWMK